MRYTYHYSKKGIFSDNYLSDCAKSLTSNYDDLLHELLLYIHL